MAFSTDGGMLDSFQKLGRFFIIDKTKEKGRWFTCPKTDDDAHLVKLKDVPSIFLNEALAAIEAIK